MTLFLPETQNGENSLENVCTTVRESEQELKLDDQLRSLHLPVSRVVTRILL